MLPDLPELKAELREIYLNYVSRRAHSQLGAFREAPRHVMHEGTAMRIERANGETEDSGMHDATAQVSISAEQAESMTRSERMQILNDLADGMAAQMAQKLFTSLGESLNRAGQTVDNGGRPLDAETILQLIELVQIDFDANGTPKLPTIQLDSNMSEAWDTAVKQLAEDPVLDARLHQLLSEKKVNWRDREAARKLVG